MQLKDYTEAQRRAWNEVAPIHKESQFEKLLSNFKTPGYSCLDPVETELLQKIGIQGKSVAQLACNNGRELLSVKNLGAGHCVGFDISGEFINQAKILAAEGKIDCEFQELDVYDMPEIYNHQFDLVYITIGAICWMPDLGKLFDVIARILKSGGSVLIYDIHPFLGMFSELDKSDPAIPKLSYFHTEPVVDTDGGLDYYTGKTYESSARWWFHYKLSDLFEAALTRKMSIVSFQEYPDDISNVFTHLEQQKAQLPLCYTLVLQKK
ncbi:MAG: class I SAM-dependent methyltransferase [Proteobacteria bacterium]|nr:class I SAM-dependent methyltransferase [Pseudomonadota bacterium]